jgi:hypothetical protein
MNRLSLKILTRAGGVVQVLECLPTTQRGPEFKHQYHQKKKKKKSDQEGSIAGWYSTS